MACPNKMYLFIAISFHFIYYYWNKTNVKRYKINAVHLSYKFNFKMFNTTAVHQALGRTCNVLSQ